MDYAKLIDSSIRYAPNPIVIDDRQIGNPPGEVYISEGYKPVVYTGAQIPLCELRSDGRENIVSSVIIAASGQVHEVCIYFNGQLVKTGAPIEFSVS